MLQHSAILNEQNEVGNEELNAPAPSRPQPAYHIITWGCQMNEEDSEQIGLFLEQMGYRAVDGAEQADVVMLNTCSVRAKPEEKVWSELGRLRDLKRTRPDLLIGVCGCMAQVESDEILRRAPHVDLVVGTGNIASIPDLIHTIQSPEGHDTGSQHRSALRKDAAPPLTDVRPAGIIPLSALLTAPRRAAGARTALALPPRKGAVVSDVPQRVVARKPKLKAHVPIMYGCDKFCTFCIVPFTRGRERSRPTAEILAEIEALAQGGTREITLLGQTVNSYGKNMPEGRVPFCDLLERIDAIRGIQRIRFTSPYPRDFTDDLIDAIGRLPKVCEHVHLPLQVGDDELLSQMHRGYTVARYREIVEKLRSRVPGIAITTDLMLGYPGETDEQVANTMRLVEEIRFDSAFMFAYSPRPNTKAADMENQVPRAVKVERLTALIALQNRITCEINAGLVGQTAEVLVEGRSPKDPTRLTGYTRTLKTVNFTVPADGTRSADSLIGKLVPVRLVQSHLTGFTGNLEES
jgi:tRNA-2-methylthio-N6-dimethylallyladenosine synthase